jgi:hypothetical protein
MFFQMIYLIGLAPIEFSINLLTRTTPILKVMYRMALAELKELKEPLQELSDKGLT